MTQKITAYYELTKPGISFMATFSALAGFLLGSFHQLEWMKLFHCLLGTLMTAAGACTMNMVLERQLDSKMKRTADRPLPQHRLKTAEALVMGLLFSFGGVLYLSAFLNFLTGILGALSCCIYLYMYTPLKKLTALCTFVGAVAGALPPMMGWVAATGSLRGDGWTLFAILFLWQFPHFLSLAYLYKDDYAKAGLHMLPWLQEISHRERSERVTGAWMAFSSAGLIFAGGLPTLLGRTGMIYISLALIAGIFMTYASMRFLWKPSREEAKRLFLASLAYVPLLMTCLILDRWFILKRAMGL